MAKNEEKFKTPEERITAFFAWCNQNQPQTGVVCDGCPLRDHRNIHYETCFAYWLALEAEKEKPEPCLFCGGETTTKHMAGGFGVVCDCGYTSSLAETEEAAVAAHNRVARAVKSAKEGDEK